MKDSQKIAVMRDFLKFAYRELQIKSAPKIMLMNDNKFAKDNKSFGGYVRSTKELFVYIRNRNLADILRTLAHELVHHRQNEFGEGENMDGATGSDTENEANAMAGILLRKYGHMNPVIFESSKTKKDKQIILEIIKRLK